MLLSEALAIVSTLNEDDVIFAKRPWGASSEAAIGPLTADLGVPPEMTGRGLEYFLEVSVANEVLEVLSGKQADAARNAALLIYYAENDAYPDWVFS